MAALRWWETNNAATTMSRQHVVKDGRTLCGVRVPGHAWEPTDGNVPAELACRRCAAGYEEEPMMPTKINDGPVFGSFWGTWR